MLGVGYLPVKGYKVVKFEIVGLVTLMEVSTDTWREGW